MQFRYVGAYQNVNPYDPFSMPLYGTEICLSLILSIH